MCATVRDPLAAPGEAWVPRRQVSREDRAWAVRADEIMVEHGLVAGADTYPRRHHARWRARKLIGLMVDLGIHNRRELREHTTAHRDGWVWAVEYLGPVDNRT